MDRDRLRCRNLYVSLELAIVFQPFLFHVAAGALGVSPFSGATLALASSSSSKCALIMI